MRWIVTLAGLFVCAASQATPIEVSFEAHIDRIFTAECVNSSTTLCGDFDISDHDSSDYYNGQVVTKGDVFRGRVTYDSDYTYDGLSSDGYQISYLNGATSGEVSAGQISLPSDSLPRSRGNLSVVDGRRGADVFSIDQTFSSSDWFASLRLALVDGTGTALNSLRPPESLSMDSFAYRELSLAFVNRSDNRNQVHFNGTLDRLSFSPMGSNVDVAEPPVTLLLLAAVIFTFGTYVRRRKRTMQTL